MQKNKRKQAGFTLMELMVVIVIVAILAAVAVPLYLNYVKDAQRTEAKGAIGAVITAEQVYYQNNQGTTYAGNILDLNVDLTEISTKWTVGVTNASANGFTVTATQVVQGTQTPLSVTYTYNRNGTSIWTTEQDAAP